MRSAVASECSELLHNEGTNFQTQKSSYQRIQMEVLDQPYGKDQALLVSE